MLGTTTSIVLCHQNFPLLLTPKSNPSFFIHNYNSFIFKETENPCCRSLSCSLYRKQCIVSATKRKHQQQQEQQEELLPQESNTQRPGIEDNIFQERGGDGGAGLGWLPTFPHVLVASMSNFLFGYHIGVMNGPIVSVAKELGFDGNSFLEGLVVSMFVGGAFLGSISSGSLVDKFGCRRTFQVDTIPLILGAIVSAQAHSLNEILWGRFLVGLGIGVNTVLVPIYISEKSCHICSLKSSKMILFL